MPDATASPSEAVVTAAARLLADPRQQLHRRFRALFTLRNTVSCTASLQAISDVLERDSCPLLKHECAYCLGQMRDPAADAVLARVLRNEAEHPMVRHEAAEALAAIGSESSIGVLEAYRCDPVPAVAHTCILALDSLKGGDVKSRVSASFGSVDPAPAAADTTDVGILSARLVDSSADLATRFAALFALRDTRSDEATAALASALESVARDPKHALLAHEVAFVLGQVQSPTTVSSLERVLRDSSVNEMVRHEAAEALGSVASEEALCVLRDVHEGETCYVVRASIQVALDMIRYETSDEFFFLEDPEDVSHESPATTTAAAASS